MIRLREIRALPEGRWTELALREMATVRVEELFAKSAHSFCIEDKEPLFVFGVFEFALVGRPPYIWGAATEALHPVHSRAMRRYFDQVLAYPRLEVSVEGRRAARFAGFLGFTRFVRWSGNRAILERRR